MPDASSFSPDYSASRARFRSAAFALGCRVDALPVGLPGPDGEELSIEVAVLGAEAPSRAVVVSSGLHGVEGFLGAAIQCALLEDVLGGFRPPEGGALVLLHALNPYGFARIRRVDDANVDLNRNFLLPGEAFAGSPPGYADLDPLLNPPSAPAALDPFYVLAAWTVARHGMPALKNAVAGGQYDFPRGLFYGGSGPSRTHTLLDRHLPRLLGHPERVLHVDVHSGLGVWGDVRLLADTGDADAVRWLEARFGPAVEPWDPSGVSYRVRGGLARWCRARFPASRYDLLTAEFGTYAVLRVVAALRAENRAHHFAKPDDPVTRRAKAWLREVFAPADRGWRDTTVDRGLGIVERAIEVCFG